MNNTWDQNVNKGCFAIIMLNFLCLGSVLLANYLIVKLIVFVGKLCCPVLLCCFINFVRQAQVICESAVIRQGDRGRSREGLTGSERSPSTSLKNSLTNSFGTTRRRRNNFRVQIVDFFIMIRTSIMPNTNYLVATVYLIIVF